MIEIKILLKNSKNRCLFQTRVYYSLRCIWDREISVEHFLVCVYVCDCGVRAIDKNKKIPSVDFPGIPLTKNDFSETFFPGTFFRVPLQIKGQHHCSRLKARCFFRDVSKQEKKNLWNLIKDFYCTYLKVYKKIVFFQNGGYDVFSQNRVF